MGGGHIRLRAHDALRIRSLDQAGRGGPPQTTDVRLTARPIHPVPHGGQPKRMTYPCERRCTLPRKCTRGKDAQGMAEVEDDGREDP